jgi:hypothetical protein
MLSVAGLFHTINLDGSVAASRMANLAVAARR